jgi:class 3 adenylate cyclase
MMTDIEGSTGLLQALGDRYAQVLNGARAVLRAAIARGGREVDARADEFFAVFGRARDAVEAAVAAQRALSRRRWPAGVRVGVRIGIHSGQPTLTDAGYIGLAVHTTARVCAAAHGGQVVISGAVRAAIGLAPPRGIRFHSLGRHRLPGLRAAEALFEVAARGLPDRVAPPVGNRGRRARA